MKKEENNEEIISEEIINQNKLNNEQRKFRISSKDIRMLKLLRNNSRASLTQLSKKTKIPISTLFDRLKLLEKGTIFRHTTLLNFKKLGYNTRVQFFLKTPISNRKSVQAYLEENPLINSVYELADDYQIMAQGIFQNINEANEFKKSLEEQFQDIEYKSHYIVNAIKREGFMTAN